MTGDFYRKETESIHMEPMKTTITRILALTILLAAAILPTTNTVRAETGMRHFVVTATAVSADRAQPQHSRTSARISTVAETTSDLRMGNATTRRSRPDRSVHTELEQFVSTLSGIELVLVVLAIVLPVSILTTVIAVFLLGHRCENCGRHRAMRLQHNDTPSDTSYVITKNGRRIYVRTVTRVCRHCGYTDTIEYFGR